MKYLEITSRCWLWKVGLKVGVVACLVDLTWAKGLDKGEKIK